MNKKIMRIAISAIWFGAGVFSLVRGNYVFLMLSIFMFCLFFYKLVKGE